MGLFKELFSDWDKPWVWRRTIEFDEPKNEIDITPLIEENKRLRKELETKRVNAIDTDFKLIE